MPEKLVLLLYQSWADLDAAVEALSSDEATVRLESASSVAWTVGHVTNMLDSWINVNFQGHPPHGFVGDPKFRSGASGDASDWPGVVEAVTEVREVARRWLDSLTTADLVRRIPYHGSLELVRSTGLPLDYALMRIAAHHFMHAGELMTVRARLGHEVPDGPKWGLALL